MQRQPEPELMDDASEARAYAEADFTAVNDAFVDRLIVLAGDRRGARAVDFGTGPGDIPIRVIKRCPAWRIVAVDAAGAMLDIARAAAGRAGLTPAIEFVLADAKATGLGAGTFDIVFSNSILHHISDTAGLWREVRRVAARGALIFLRDLARPESEEAAREIVRVHAGAESALLKEEFHRSLLSAYTPEEARVQLAGAGLGGLTVERINDRHMDIFGRV